MPARVVVARAALAIILLLPFSITPGRAQVSPEIANQVNRAVAAFQDGDYQRALELFQGAAQRALAYRPTVDNLLLEAQLELRRGSGESALEAIDRALELDPSSASAHVLRGHVLRRMGRASEAFAALDRALELDPTSSMGAEELWRLLDPRREHGRAIATYRKHLERAPESLYLLFHLGKAYEKVEDYDRAESAFLRALEVDPRQSVIHNHLLQTLDRKEGDRGAVIAVYEKLAEERPEPMPRLFLARLYLESGRDGDAEALLDELAGADVDSVDTSMRLAVSQTYAEAGLFEQAAEQVRRVITAVDAGSTQRIELFFDLGKWLVGAGRVEEGIRQLERSMRLHETNLRTPPLATYFQLGRAYRQLGDREQAEFHFRRFNRGLEQVGDFTDTETLTHLGDIYMEDGNHRRAADHYQRVVGYDPSDHGAQLKLARALLAQGSWEEAIVAAVEAVDATNGSAESSILLARAYLADRQPSKAMTVLRELEGRGELGFEGAAVMGEALLAADEGSSEAALEYIERAYDSEPASPDRALLYAQVLTSLGRFDRARGLYRGVLEQSPEEVAALEGLGRLEVRAAERRWRVLRRGPLEAAVAHLRQARALAPTDLGVRSALADAERERAGAVTLVRTLRWIGGGSLLAVLAGLGLSWHLRALWGERLHRQVAQLESELRELVRRGAMEGWGSGWQEEITRGAYGERIGRTYLQKKARKLSLANLLDASTFGQLIGLIDVGLKDPDDRLRLRARCNDSTRDLVLANLEYIGHCRDAIAHLRPSEGEAGDERSHRRGRRWTVANLMNRQVRRSVKVVRENFNLGGAAVSEEVPA